MKLNIDRINSSSPYTVSLDERGTCHLVTDSGVMYLISFIEDDLLQYAESYQMIISNVSNKKSPRDSKLRRTILAIIYEFFENSEHALLYICDTGDRKQRMRQRLFSYWFNSSSRKSDFAFMSADITDIEGIQNYAAIILRIDNPSFESIMNEFYMTVRVLRQKP